MQKVGGMSSVTIESLEIFSRRVGNINIEKLIVSSVAIYSMAMWPNVIGPSGIPISKKNKKGSSNARRSISLSLSCKVVSPQDIYFCGQLANPIDMNLQFGQMLTCRCWRICGSDLSIEQKQAAAGSPHPNQWKAEFMGQPNRED